ncbi:hypothetical protein Elen_2848 [Eggerthella lenta DSM 2243]|uniref:Uncharacterized protein n=1 Tax=Eggerthella lenta (strain ATCC 25559 / DSM 2243 / CCUG 17323 / JCM 9979 / KCTC 3265 / NCTC 11813 / VPI 0255 / 1899 B) TaxID=479437 RepID=C8WN72_EGGLE|nr:hypothetical protein Elen_2848 [Eggerthella lenta DSM 2243]
MEGAGVKMRLRRRSAGRGRAPVRGGVGEAAPVGGGRQPRGPAAAFGPNGLAPASPAEGREAGRQRTHAMHDYRGLPTEARRETPGRKKWRGRRIVHSAHSLPCAGKRSVAGRSPARVPSCAPPPTRTDVSRETSRLTGMRAAPRAGRAARRQPRTGDWEPARQPGGCSLMFVETRHGKDIKAERGKKTGSRERPTMP